MLVLSRRSGEQIVLPGLGIVITVVAVTGGRARIGIVAPAEVRVLRAEINLPPVGSGCENRCRPPVMGVICDRTADSCSHRRSSGKDRVIGFFYVSAGHSRRR